MGSNGVGMAIGTKLSTDPRIPANDSMRNPLYTPFIRRRQGVTAF